jgi:hypothetical protein
MLVTIDNTFAAIIPQEIKDNAEKINNLKALKMGVDNNTLSKIC